MAHDVFVSHSSKDKPTADAVCAMLESQGIRCWVAPRDITPGMDWGEAIVEALKGARVMVLVFSANANASPQIKREVERAVNKGIPIIPLRIEDVAPTASLEYFISTPHWLDAFTPPLETHLKFLAQIIGQMLERQRVAVPPSVAADSSGSTAKSEGQTQKVAGSTRRGIHRIRQRVGVCVGAALLVAFVSAGWWFGIEKPRLEESQRRTSLEQAKRPQGELAGARRAEEKEKKEAADTAKRAEEERQAAEALSKSEEKRLAELARLAEEKRKNDAATLAEEKRKQQEAVKVVPEEKQKAAAVTPGRGGSVALIYNKNLPESKALAEFYAGRRGVPLNQLFGADVNAASETMSRAEFREKLQDPLFDWLVKEKLFTLNPKKRTVGVEYRNLTDAKIRYLVLCYGVPLKIARDAEIKEEGMDKIQEQLRGRNEAAVDADLALLPNSAEKFPITGPVVSPFYLSTNAAVFHPTNGILMVARLDGPTVDIARGLVDKAMRAESDGLWGHAYIDSRGLTSGELKMGDDWMNGSAAIVRRMGFETKVDDKEAMFDAGFPMSQVAFYVGWYGLNASGPFERPTVEFMPGAFAYHLHSFSAATLRSTDHFWVGPLLAKGATITMGCVDEPYLAGTPNVAAFLERLIGRRWTFGEAAYGCQSTLSWQTTVVGDPLYAPFAQPPDALHYKLEHEKNPLVEWSHLRVVNLNLATGSSVADVTNYLHGISAIVTNSAVLQEKVGDFALADKNVSAACEAYGKALQLKPSPQQKIRLLLMLGHLQSGLGRSQEAYDAYFQLVSGVPDYPDAAKVFRELTGLARKLGKSKEAERFSQEAERLSVPAK